MTSGSPKPELRAEVADLRARLAEAEETLRAIRAGEVDALVITGSQGDEVHLLGEGDRIYRQFIEAASEGTATVSADGEIRSCSAGLAKTLRRPLAQVLGTAIRDHLSPDDHEMLSAILAHAGSESSRQKVCLKTSAGRLVPVYLSATLLHSAGAEPDFCLVFTDLEEVISAEETLFESATLLRESQIVAGLGSYVLDIPSGRWRSSDVMDKLFGIGEAYERTVEGWLALIHPDDRAGMAAYFENEVLGQGRTFDGDYRIIRRDDQAERWVHGLGRLAFDGHGRPLRMHGTIQDITERKEAEARILRLARLYAGLSQCNAAIVRSADESELFPKICRNAVQYGGMKMAWIGLVNEASQRVRPVASYGEGTEYLHDIRISVDAGDPFGRGPTGTSIRENRPFWCQDFQHDPVTAPWQERAARYGWAASGSLPLLRGGNPVGSLTVYAGKVNAFDEEIRQQASDMAENISFALDKFALEAERKLAETRTREQARLLDLIFEHSLDCIVLLDKDYNFIRVSETYARICSRTVAELQGRNHFELYPSPLKDEFDDAIRRRVIYSKSSRPFTFPDHPEWGVTYWDLGMVPIRGADDNIEYILYTLKDVTERKRAETELREAEVRYHLLFDHSPDGIVVIDPATARLLEFNETAHRQLGYSREEFARLSISDIEAAETPEETRARVAGVICQGRSDFETRHRTRQGEIRNVHVTAQVTEMLARPVFHCVWRDITEQRRLADEKAGLEDQLRQAQKVEAIGRLAGGVAHDFNNLTAIVLGYGEMLLGQLRPEEPARKWVEQIVEAGKRSATLTRQLLAFSRKQVLLPVVLDLNDLLRNLERMLARLIGENIELKFDLAGDLGRITADPGQIEQVVTNLVLNARDAMPRGGRLTVETTNEELDETYALGHVSVVPGKYVKLALTDTGCGMDKATLARLFEPFFTTKERGKGTGLGLATAFGIVKQSGGYLYAYSEPDKGTTFKIYLPWTDAAPTMKVIEIVGEVARGSDERILLVEDEGPLRELCEIVLSRLGYRVSAAGSGPEALLLVEEQGFEPDLVLTDVIMPGMSGAEMAQRLRQDRPGLKVLYMSGYPDHAIAPHGVLGPGTFFLQKPFSERVLAGKVREALVGRKPMVVSACRRVLMIDDDEQFLDLVRHFCEKRGHVFAGVNSTAAALATLAAQSFDVLLVDLNIPGTSGERVLRAIRAAGHTAPAIVLTGDAVSADMAALRPLGVVQVTEKSSDGEPLLLAIEAVGSLKDTRSRDEQQEV